MLRVQDSGMRVTPRSYGTSVLHHVFTLEVLSGSYLGHVFDAPGGLCLVAVSYHDICDSWTDKPLWLDGYS